MTTDAIYNDADIDQRNADADANELAAELKQSHVITDYEVFGERRCYGCGRGISELDNRDAPCTGGTK